MFLEIVSPEAVVFSGKVKSATFYGKNGMFQVLKDHAPIIAALDKGPVRVITQSDEEQIFDAPKGGFVQVLNNEISVLI